MAAIYKNLVAENRTRLEEVIPLKTPFSVCIDPCNACNFQCSFCAIHKSDAIVGFQKTIMKLEHYKKIVDDIARFESRLKVLRLSGQGEPMLNPDYPDFIAYAKEKRIADFIETITNGSMLNPELNKRIVASGIDRIRISVESINAKGYQDIASARIDYDHFVDQIRDLYEQSRGHNLEIYVKTVDAAVPDEYSRQLFLDTFSDVCDRIFIDKVIPLWSDFMEINQYFDIKAEHGVHGQAIQPIQICPYPFYSCIINPDGQVTVCCADWKRKLVVGNAIEESIVDIWNGDKMRAFWADLAAEQKNKYEMCRKCVLPTFDCNDNIDDYGEVILRRLQGVGGH